MELERGMFSDSLLYQHSHLNSCLRCFEILNHCQGYKNYGSWCCWIPCNLRMCQHKDPEEQGPGFMSFFKEKTPASVPKTQYKWPHNQILRGVDFDGLWLHNQITDQWKGETWGSQHTHELEGEKKKNIIFLFEVHSVSLKEWIILTGTSELKRKIIHCFLKGGGHIYRIIWWGTSIETGKIGREGFVEHWRVNLVGFHSQHWRGGGVDDAYSNSCFVLMCFLVAPPADTLILGPSASPAQKASLCHCGPDVTLTFLFLFATSWIKPTFLFLFCFPLVVFIE